jgi:hypothetical protein
VVSEEAALTVAAMVAVWAATSVVWVATADTVDVGVSTGPEPTSCNAMSTAGWMKVSTGRSKASVLLAIVSSPMSQETYLTCVRLRFVGKVYAPAETETVCVELSSKV